MFDAQSILLRMRGDMPEGINTTEGTFAGDILAACAQEFARIHNQEMEEMAGRAFVSTATGEWLDMACADYGIERKEQTGESGEAVAEGDEELRARALYKVRSQASSGNAAHYRTWALEVAGVKGVTVAPRNRGQGTVDIFILGADSGLCQRVKDYIEERRPVGVDVGVFAALPFEVMVSGMVRVGAGGALSAVASEFDRRFTDFLHEQGMSGNGRLVGLAKVSGLLMQCGAVDVVDLKLNGVANSMLLGNGKYAVALPCSITEDVS